VECGWGFGEGGKLAKSYRNITLLYVTGFRTLLFTLTFAVKLLIRTCLFLAKSHEVTPW
jgi:hypothetical protein